MTSLLKILIYKINTKNVILLVTYVTFLSYLSVLGNQVIRYHIVINIKLFLIILLQNIFHTYFIVLAFLNNEFLYITLFLQQPPLSIWPSVIALCTKFTLKPTRTINAETNMHSIRKKIVLNFNDVNVTCTFYQSLKKYFIS